LNIKLNFALHFLYYSDCSAGFKGLSKNDSGLFAIIMISAFNVETN